MNTTIPTLALTGFFAFLSIWAILVAENTQAHVDKVNQEQIDWRVK